MEEYRWEKCPFFGEGQCPHSKVIDRAYLIPQLLNATKFEAAVRLCTNCGHYLSERRKYVRLRKPFRSYIYKEDGETTIIGNIVNVSGVGTLVRLEDWPQFDIQEKVKLEIYSTHAPLEAV